MIRNALTILLILLLTGCVSSGPIGNPELPYPPQKDVEVGDILHLATGEQTSMETLLEHAAQARIIYVGETHDNPASHRLQLDILTHLQSQNPGKVAMAMEMFNPTQQDILDRWTAGELSEKEFLKESQWYSTWKMDFAYYRPLLEYAQDNRIPVIGINAPKDLVSAVGMSPVEELAEEIREQLPEFDFSDPYQLAMAQAIYSDHPSGSMKDGFLRIQTLWDESMAENLTNYLKSDDGSSRQAVVIAGGNHVSYGFGIPRRAFRRLPASYLLIGSKTIEIDADKDVVTMNVRMPRFPMPPYDFVTFTRYENLPEQGVKLGVHLQEIEKDVTILSVLPGSAAEYAGLQPEDIVRKIDGINVEENFDLVYELKQKQREDKAVLSIEREGEVQEIEVDFSTADEHPKS